MSSLREIRSRLHSIENIKKISDAMERVAVARLRRAQIAAEQARPYASKIKEVVGRFAASPNFLHPLLTPRTVHKTALIVVGSDKGLCGSYNADILSAAKQFLKNYSPNDIDLFVFGRRAIDYFQHTDWPIASQNVDWGGKISLPQITEFSDKLITNFLHHAYDEVCVLYTHYISIARRSVTLDKLLPIEKPKKNIVFLNSMVEPGPEEILARVLPHYFVVRIQEALFESYASELGARIMAMQMASKNSQEMTVKLTLLRNRMRQEAITKEMIEIASGTY